MLLIFFVIRYNDISSKRDVTFMDYEFGSLKELFKRVSPALTARQEEFRRLGYSNIKGLDIWNYLIETKWKNGKNLMLSDIVSDIMNADGMELNSYLETKNFNSQKTHSFDDNIEII